MEPVKFRCTQCGASLAAGEELFGRMVKCRKCGQPLRVPTPRTPAPAPGPAGRPPPPPPAPPDAAYDLDALAASADSFPSRDPAPADPLPPRAGFEPTPTRRGSSESSRPGKTFASVGSVAGLMAALVFAGVAFRAVRTAVRLVNPPNAVQGAEATDVDQNVGFVEAPLPDLPREALIAPRVASSPSPAQSAVPPTFRDLGEGRLIEPGIRLHEVTLVNRTGAPGQSGKLLVYLPAEAPAEPGSLPCILIAPAGTDMMSGATLDDGSPEEHRPWVRAGFAVVAYSLDGDPGDRPEGQNYVRAVQQFLRAEGGVANARVALAFIAEKVPQVDRSRIYAVGHSSAGTVALLVAEREPRIQGVVAFAPGAYEGVFRDQVRRVSAFVPEAETLLTALNPAAPENEARLSVPVFLFTAEDDSVVPPRTTRATADRLRGLGKNVTFETVPSGDHFNAMVQEGVPRAIAWVKGLAAGGR
jgi:dienelactone hydrolase